MLGHTLKLIRLYNCMGVNAVALQMQMCPRMLNKIEICKTKISLSTLTSFSELYQMPINQILMLNDMKEHLQISDSQLWKDIESFYVTKQDRTMKIITKNKLGV